MSQHLIPVHVPASQHCFFIKDGGERTVELIPGHTLQTAPLRTGVPINLIGISMSPDSVRQGLHEQTDVIQPSVMLKALYFQRTDTPEETFQSLVFEPGEPFKPVTDGAVGDYAVEVLVSYLHPATGKELLIRGEINLETAQVFFPAVEVTTEVEGEIRTWKLVGYELIATRGPATRQ